MSLVDTPAWQALAVHAEAVRPLHLRELFAADPERFERFSRRQDGLLLDFSKQRINAVTIEGEDAQLLFGQKKGVALRIRNVDYGSAIKPIAASDSYYHGSRYPMDIVI